MRIMLTVLGEQGDRDVVIEAADDATVALVAASLGAPEPLATVVRLPRARAPYGMSEPPARVSTATVGEPELWRNGKTLDPRAPARSVLRDGDKVTLDPDLARATVSEEPGGVAEVRVVGGPAAGTVHRLGLGVHVIGSDPMCAIAVSDPALAPEAATIRVTPDAITVEPIRRGAQTQRLKLKGRWAEEVAEMTARVEAREAARLPAHEQPQLDARPLTDQADWPEHALLACGSSLFTLTAIQPPDAHLAPRPEGGVAYNRPPRLRRPEAGRRFQRPAEP
ncbi:MAG: cell division protein FtsK, partial [Nonomuraea sp.]|nr:cell division protein FtsK [Nonomuraea sp.]